MSARDRIRGMSRDEFWRLIALGKTDPEDFFRNLERMTRDELIGFVWMFDELKADLYEDYSGSQTSEDSIDDVLAYVVEQGREFFERIRDNPEQIPDKSDPFDLPFSIPYEAYKAYRRRFGEDLPPL